MNYSNLYENEWFFEVQKTIKRQRQQDFLQENQQKQIDNSIVLLNRYGIHCQSFEEFCKNEGREALRKLQVEKQQAEESLSNFTKKVAEAPQQKQEINLYHAWHIVVEQLAHIQIEQEYSKEKIYAYANYLQEKLPTLT